MTDPLPPHDIPDDTTALGLVGWIGESLLRSFALRLAALTSLLTVPITVAVSDGAPVPARVGLVLVGVVSALALLHSQLAAWPRSRQWTLIAAVLAVTVPACIYLLST